MKEKTKQDLDGQLLRVLGGAPSGVDSMATESGSKDKHFQYFVDKMQAACSKLREERRTGRTVSARSEVEDVKQLLREMCAEMPEDLFNPVLYIAGMLLS